MSLKQVYDTVSSCSQRYNVTSEPWLVPFRSLEEADKDVKLVDIREPPYIHTHELVPNFQVCRDPWSRECVVVLRDRKKK